MDHNWQAPKGNMKLDGGYNGSMQQAIANLEIGRDQGRRQGQSEGFEQGREYGYAEGWNAGIARANEKLHPLRENFRLYFDEAIELRAKLAHQQKVIDVMIEQLAKAAQVETARAEQSQHDSSAEEVIRLRNAEGLQGRIIAAMEMQYKATYAQSCQKTEQYKRSLIFTHIAQMLLRELVAPDTAEASHIRARFAEIYQEQVAQSMELGDIQAPPEEDDLFRKHLPETLAFIQHMLSPDAPVRAGD
jgi:hypothetical protein